MNGTYGDLVSEIASMDVVIDNLSTEVADLEADIRKKDDAIQHAMDNLRELPGVPGEIIGRLRNALS